MTVESLVWTVVATVVTSIGGGVVLWHVGAASRRYGLLLIGSVAVVAACTTAWPQALWPAAVPLGAFGLPAAVVDLVEHRIPNQASAMFVVSEAAGITGIACVSETPEMLFRAAVGGLGWGGLLLVSFVVSGQPGPGDVKLVPSLGMLAGAAGWSAIGTAIALCYLLAGCAALALVVSGRRQARIPLAPAMVGGTVLAVTMTSLAA
ncbi:prepilin peptidase [Amycolatopsis ultiminotia]|uniref:Prepilin peptidase n=1 Tax=Amycolatopsis ultiminotia TaxID=543629 RepID=A0ABP6WDQ6_9PSEU